MSDLGKCIAGLTHTYDDIISKDGIMTWTCTLCGDTINEMEDSTP